MSLRLYCNRFAHFKDALVCSVSCPFRTRCRDFALFYDANKTETDAQVATYYRQRQGRLNEEKSARDKQHTGRLAPRIATVAELHTLIILEVKRILDTTFIWIGTDDHAEIVSQEEVIARAERGQKAKHIFKVAQEMELKFQLVPRRQIDKVKRLAQDEQQVTAARRAAQQQATAATRLRALNTQAEAVADEGLTLAVPTIEAVSAPRRRRRVAG